MASSVPARMLAELSRVFYAEAGESLVFKERNRLTGIAFELYERSQRKLREEVRALLRQHRA